jgi:hypothetical protein
MKPEYKSRSSKVCLVDSVGVLLRTKSDGIAWRFCFSTERGSCLLPELCHIHWPSDARTDGGPIVVEGCLSGG